MKYMKYKAANILANLIYKYDIKMWPNKMCNITKYYHIQLIIGNITHGNAGVYIDTTI